MDLSRLLCSSPEQQEDEVAPTVNATQHATQVTQPQRPAWKAVRDGERKKPYRMSATQRQRRQEHQAYESRVFNLTLDINELRQQIRYLEERRDLYNTRLVLRRQQFGDQVLGLVRKLLASNRSETFGLTPSGGVESSGGVYQYVMVQGRPAFTHRSFALQSVRVLALVNDGSTTGEEAAHTRQVCGPAGGCIVELWANFTGRIIGDTFAALFPFVRSDALAAQMIGATTSFSARGLLYFDVQQHLVRQVMQADVVAALEALHISAPDDAAARGENHEANNS
jgi:hypothetical protein